MTRQCSPTSAQRHIGGCLDIRLVNQSTIMPVLYIVFLLAAGLVAVVAHEGHLHGRSTSRTTEQAMNRCDTAEPTRNDLEAQQRAVRLLSFRPLREASLITVPVCFHVVAGTDGRGALSDTALQQQLNAMNVAFSGSSCCNTALDWCNPGDCSVDTGFRFAMATVNSAGQVIPGQLIGQVNAPNACVTRTVNDVWTDGGRGNEQSMKFALYKGDGTVLNVYSVDFTRFFLLGYATYPWNFSRSPKMDGVVINARSFPGGSLTEFNEGDTMVHEVGHWLGLVHTFQGGCISSDGVEDTAPERTPNYGCTNPRTRNTCPEDPRTDPVFNFMDYSHDVCLFEFTIGQTMVMQACWDVYRLGNDDERPQINLAIGQLSDPFSLIPGERQVFAFDVEAIRAGIECRVNGNEGRTQLHASVKAPPNFNEQDLCVDVSSGSNKFCFIPRRHSPYKESFLPIRLICSIPFLRYLCPGTKNACGIGCADTLYVGVKASESVGAEQLTLLCTQR